jgi:serine phosphatase RsbU (regulator of sigma subunit)/anti-sigma regulatory factor (Ser/Thr protein kinase)/putative methionine-R-sulfoxide reductase with GAF domain
MSAASSPARPPADQRTLAALQRVTDAALAHLTEDELLEELLRRVTEVLATDTAAILLLDEERDVLRARAARGIEEEVEQGVEIPVGGGFAGRVAAERKPRIIDDVDHADILNPILREKGIRSLLGVPLLVEGRVLGVMHVGSLKPRRFTPDETDLLQLAADRAAMAIEHASLYEQERRARSAAETVKERLEALQQITDAALAYLPQDQLLAELLERVTGIFAADTAAILLLDADRGVLKAHAARGIEEEVEQGVEVPVGRGFAGRIAEQRSARVIDDIERADIFNPILREKGIRSLLGVPLLVEGRVLGVMHVGSLVPRHFSDDERDLLQLAGDRAAVAIEHQHLYEQRQLAEALQRRILQADLRGSPITPGLEIGSRYLPASGESLGGDWYDAFPLPGGRIAMAVGDVVGHGIEAAAVMAQLRTALRAYAAEGHPPAGVVERVNRLMIDLGPETMTTLAFVVFDPEAERLELVNAGHPPPLVIDPQGGTRFLEDVPGVPLGVKAAAPYEVNHHDFANGSTIVLYTDGLVEVRGETIDAGLERLRSVAELGLDVEELCEAVVQRLIPGERTDDVALVAARVPEVPEHLSGRWPARTHVLAGIRQLLRRWLRKQGVEDGLAYDVILASQEACANCIEHAYGPGDGEFELEAVRRDEQIEVTVRDSGRWRDPRGEDRGRGLNLMRSLVDSVEIGSTEQGTTIVLRQQVGRP